MTLINKALPQKASYNETI